MKSIDETDLEKLWNSDNSDISLRAPSCSGFTKADGWAFWPTPQSMAKSV